MSMIDPELLNSVIERCMAASPFLARSIVRHPDVVHALQESDLASALKLAAEVDATTLATRLRLRRGRTLLALALPDLVGVVPLEPVVAALSDFADYALDAAIVEAVTAHVPGAEARGFAAIALGKHGSRELNYSSDIDPIFIYDPAILPHRAREEPAEAAVRIARRIVDLLQTRDGDGFVFRVDLRLRPASEATPLALPVEAAIAHYESSAMAWERAAFIRARAAAGDIALGQMFLETIRPFVWRRSLDFGAVGDLRALTRRIRGHHGGQAFGPGYDVKRGRGGIREVEFYTQIHQLIHGGRNPELRAGATMPALAGLARAGWIDHGTVDALTSAYRLLRTIEHRLQLIDDRQTHLLPTDRDALDQVARLHGVADGAALLGLLGPHVAAVGTLYDALDDDEARPVASGDRLADELAKLGFSDAAAAEARIVRWRAGGTRAIRSPAAVQAFESLLPDMLATMATVPDPDAALARLDLLLGRLSSGVNLFRLLDAQPVLRALLVDILSHAPTLADALAVRPALLDRLIDRSALGAVPELPALVTELRGDAGPAETLYDRVRHVVGEYRFALGTQIVAGTADPLAVAAGYARLAEAAVEVVTARVVDDFVGAHGHVPGGELVILALGRLGGGLLTHASDLDLIYLFTGDESADSTGTRPLGAAQYANRLAQRVTAALSVPTSVGPLYEVDTRLRPSGAQGPLVVTLDAFARYQREAAWTWEHMALARSRVVFGSAEARAATQAVIEQSLRLPHDTNQLARDVVAMRRDVAAHKPPKGPLDVKLGPGGLVDLEFAVHYHQLASGIGHSPDLRVAIDALADAGLVDAALLSAHDLLTRLLVTLRLIAPDLDIPRPASQALVSRACDVSDWPTLLVDLDLARQTVGRHWDVVRTTGDRA